MFCANCGKPLVPGARFCGQCGAVIADSSVTGAPAPSVARVAPGCVAASPTGTTLAAGAASSTVVWLLAFAPLIGVISESLIARKTDADPSQLWIVTVLLNILLCSLDARLLKRDGVKGPSVWAVFLIPVYLYKRTQVLGQNKAYFFVWIATFVLSLGADRVIALPYAEGQYHLDEAWTMLRLKPGALRYFIISGGSVRFKGRSDGPEYRLNLEHPNGFTDLEGHQLSLLDPDGPDAQAYNTSGTREWVRCEHGSECVLTISYSRSNDRPVQEQTPQTQVPQVPQALPSKAAEPPAQIPQALPSKAAEPPAQVRQALPSEAAPADTSQPPVAPQPPASTSPPAPPVEASKPTSGVLCNGPVEVRQNWELTFRNLPGDRLKFTFDHDAWLPRIQREPDGTQTLIMRSIKPGIQTRCDVQWEIVQ